jgi:hypothetical protein
MFFRLESISKVLKKDFAAMNFGFYTAPPSRLQPLPGAAAAVLSLMKSAPMLCVSRLKKSK